MNAIFAAAVLVVLSIAPAVSADSATRSVSITTTTEGRVGQCESQVLRSVSVCDARGACDTLTLNDEVRFEVPRGGSFTVTATTSGSNEAGVIVGNASIDRFPAARATTRLLQTVEAGKQCSYSFSYDIAVK